MVENEITRVVSLEFHHIANLMFGIQGEALKRLSRNQHALVLAAINGIQQGFDEVARFLESEKQLYCVEKDVHRIANQFLSECDQIPKNADNPQVFPACKSDDYPTHIQTLPLIGKVGPICYCSYCETSCCSGTHHDRNNRTLYGYIEICPAISDHPHTQCT